MRNEETRLTPAVGHGVHYVSHGTPIQADGTQAYTKHCRTAFVTEVMGNVVGLAVLNPDGLFFHSLGKGGAIGCQVGHGSADWSCTGQDHEGGTWHWPAE